MTPFWRCPDHARVTALATVFLLPACNAEEPAIRPECPVVSEALDSWGLTGEVLPAAAPADMSSRVRRATGAIGVWILDDAGAAGARRLTRVSPEGIERLAVDADCSVTRSVPTDSSLPAGVPSRAAVTGSGPPDERSDVFDDQDLRESLTRSDLVIYVWSPHMPLSVDGYAEIERATAELGLELVPLLFAGSDREFAGREAHRVGIPARGLREVGSIELIMRDAQVHAPSVLLFHAGVASPVLPGYRDAAGYRDFLDTRMRRQVFDP